MTSGSTKDFLFELIATILEIFISCITAACRAQIPFRITCNNLMKTEVHRVNQSFAN